MYKIKSIRFIEHPVLGNLVLDFTDEEGHAVDTVIIAGENGCGKSTVMNALYDIVSRTKSFIGFEADLIVESPDGDITFTLRDHLPVSGQAITFAKNDQGLNAAIRSDKFGKKYPFAAIYSDVDINFHSGRVSSVTSQALDDRSDSRRSDGKLPSQIKQLIVDIQALDDSDNSEALRAHPKMSYEEMVDAGFISERMPRFTNAFSRMFDCLAYTHIGSYGGHKEIFFTKDGEDIPIDGLSSGEKQIIYRGCFLLRDANAMKGAFVFIDEPEISLHPRWQSKILDYYKGIFTDSEGNQTSQIFIVTHSPFVVHNESRRRDIVIVLERNGKGRICVDSTPSFYACDSIRAVENAFHIPNFLGDSPTVFLEGTIDERYFNKAVEVYGLNLPFKFRMVGRIDAKGNDIGSGSGSLKNAAKFLRCEHFGVKCACLFDCDTNHECSESERLLELSMPKFENSAEIDEGIENALVMPADEFKLFIVMKPNGKKKYGLALESPEFKKSELCDYVCAKDIEELKIVFSNLKKVIDDLIPFFEN